MKSPTIESIHYMLRPFTKSNAALWQVWDIDPEVQAHMPGPLNEPEDIAEQCAYIEACEADEEGYYWSIETTDGVTIGTVAFTEFNKHHGVADLGIVIGDKNYWGTGVATEVLTALVRYAFAHMGIVRISAEVEAENVPMTKVLEKIGFTQDGLFESARVKNGKRVNVLHFGIVKK